MSLGAADELWIRLAWFCRLRWGVPPALVALGAVVNYWAGPLVPLRATSAIVACVWGLNICYVVALRRWQAAPESHARQLRGLAHLQVLLDVGAMTGAIYVTGGGRSPFWPFCSVTTLAAAMFFARPRDVLGYGVFTVAAFAAVSWIRGGIQPSTLLLASLVGNCGIISVYFARRTEELAKLREEARRKEQVLSLVSHELGNPLAALRASVYLAKERTRPSHDAAVEKSLQRIDAQVERMARLVGDLYDMSSVQQGQLRIEPATCDLIPLIDEVVDRFRTLHPKLQLKVEAPAAAWGNWDAHRLDQLATNLLQNAAKYAGEEAQVRITVRPASGTSMHLSVADDGPGIPADRLPTIFEPFQRYDQSGHKKGLGLGLALARQIAVLHGGALWAESEVGAGTIFHVRLPTGGVRAPS
jgi:signal transduction histidine kinase